jgi:hypothetical protein
MSSPYISFEEFDAYLANDPLNGVDWAAKPENDRLKWHNWIHNQINQHPWKGQALASFVERQAFPRKIQSTYDCYFTIIRFDSDSDATEPRDIVIPRQWIAEAVNTIVSTEDLSELQQLRDMGVKNTITGPLETEFFPGASGQGTPLPEPLWSGLQGFSRLTETYVDTFEIYRG